MRHEAIKVYVYDVTVDEKTERIERPYRIDYKRSIEDAKAKGHKVSFKFIESYIWS